MIILGSLESSSINCVAETTSPSLMSLKSSLITTPTTLSLTKLVFCIAELAQNSEPKTGRTGTCARRQNVSTISETHWPRIRRDDGQVWRSPTMAFDGLRPLGDRHLSRLRPSSRLILGQFVSLLVSTRRLAQLPVRSVWFTLLGEFCQTMH